MVTRRIAVGLEEIRRAGPRRAVHVALEPADPHPVVTAVRTTHGLGDCPPGIEREIERRPHREPARALDAAIAREIGPRRGYVGGGGEIGRASCRERGWGGVGGGVGERNGGGDV